ncbi:MAG: N-acetylglucosamine-6-phosphate deacetylase, partial [Clostridia bacterium]
MSKAKQTIFAHHALTPAGWLADQYVSVDAGHIQGLSSTGRADREADYLVFGMADVHNHGGMGFDASHPTPEGLAQWTWSLAQHGVTDVLITLATGDAQGVQAALSQIAAAMEKQREGKLPGAQIMGVHLEGPFISPKRPGAMNVTMIQPPSVAAYDALVGDDGALVRLVSLAPEVSGADALIDALNLRGIRVQAGHTDASYEEGVHAFGRGVGAVCHFFNAARSIHHRDPGLLTAALLSPSIYCELICDTIHIHPAALR